MPNNASSFFLVMERNTIVVFQTRPRASLPSAVTGSSRPAESNSGEGMSQRSYSVYTAHHIIHSQRSPHYANRTLLNLPVSGIPDPPEKSEFSHKQVWVKGTVLSWSHERPSSQTFKIKLDTFVAEED